MDNMQQGGALAARQEFGGSAVTLATTETASAYVAAQAKAGRASASSAHSARRWKRGNIVESLHSMKTVS